MEKRKILIGSPICQKPAILEAFLLSIKRLWLMDYEVHYHFIDNNYELHSREILDGFQQRAENVLIEHFSEHSEELYHGHNWSENKIWKVANYKDHIIRRAWQEDFDYLFLIDSDLLLYPQTVAHLIETGKEIIAEIFWTIWSEGAIEQPQVWLTDFYTQYKKDTKEVLSVEEEWVRTRAFFNLLRTPGVYEVGGLGACTLIAKSAIKKGVSFKRIKNISFWGEDRHFCVRAAALGIDLFVDTQYPACHIYRDSELQGGREFLKATAANL